jgi:Protein of unknown function (DUF2586)
VSLPNAQLNALDGGLPVVPSSTGKIVAKIGAASLGTAVANIPVAFGFDLNAVKTALGTGPLVDAVCESLSIAGGPIVAVPTTNSLAGTASAVTRVGTSGTSVMTVQLPGGGTCAPRDAYSVEVTITRSALGIAVGGGAFTYSLDGGNTNSPELAVPVSGLYTIPNTGLQLAFAEGTLAATDAYTFTCTAPAPSVADVGTALSALIASSQPFSCVHILGAPAPVLSAVTVTKGGSPTPPTCTVTGPATAAVDIVVKITTTGGDAGTAKFKISTDGGATFGIEATTPSGGGYTTSLGSGITFHWANGGVTYTVGDCYYVNSYGGLAALFSAVDTLMTSAANLYKWAFAIIECPDVSDAIITKAVAGLASAQGRMMVVGGACQLNAALSYPGGASFRRSASWPVATRVAASEISEDLGRVKSGPIPDVSALYRDEQQTPLLASLHVESLRTIPGTGGFWVSSATDGNMMSAVGSDYSLVQFRRVMDEACRAALPNLIRELNDDLLADPKTGYILPSEAARIEGSIGAAIKGDLMSCANRLGKPHISAYAVRVKRDEQIVLTKNLTVSISLVPKGYAKSIVCNLSFAATVATA